MCRTPKLWSNYEGHPASRGFIVHVPALPEVCTQGESEDDALAMAKVAIELAVESRMSEGEEVPTERAPQVHQQAS